MSVSLSVQADQVTVMGCPFDLGGAPRAKVDFGIDPELGVFEMDAIEHKYFGLGEMFGKFTRDITLTPPPVRHHHYGLAIINSRQTAKFMDGEWLNLREGEFYFTHNPGVDEVHRFTRDCTLHTHFLDIQPDYVTELLRGYSPEKNTPLWYFKDQVSRNEFAGSGGTVSMPAFYQVLHGMFNCPLSGPLGQMMLEGSMQQLMALQFAMMGSTKQTESISRRDREVMHAVKDFLHANFQCEHSLLDLSKRFGINQNKLKTNFRELFGKPVIAYLYDLKMEHGRSLLLDKGMNVSEVAPIVGYRNANHFSTAFKRRFGVNPSRLKN
jgi:AraC-like DNA-binding protein